MTFSIGNIVFKTKATAKKHIQKILRSALLGQPLPPDEFTLIRDLLQRHPEASKKIGCGLLHITTATACYGTIHFLAVRVDGSSTDFSYASCLDRKVPTVRESMFDACRDAVNNHIKAFKRGKFETGTCICAISGVALAMDEAHVDHFQPQFHVIVENFFKEHPQYNIDDPTLITVPADNQTRTQLTNPTMKAEFIAYHERVAELRIIKQELNWSRSRNE